MRDYATKKMTGKETTVDMVVSMLTERINSGEYSPGTRLPSERKLQEKFGVGRLALREALSRLNALGIIETSHGRGTFVLNHLQSSTLKNILIPHFALSDTKRLQELVDARAMIESEIAGLAARQHTIDDIRRLERIIEQDVDQSTPPELVAYLDLQFHQELALIVDNHFLVLMHEALTSHIRTFLNGFVKSSRNPMEVLQAHRPILEAIRRGDADDARRLVRLHITYSKRDYEHFIQENGVSASFVR